MEPYLLFSNLVLDILNLLLRSGDRLGRQDRVWGLETIVDIWVVVEDAVAEGAGFGVVTVRRRPAGTSGRGFDSSPGRRDLPAVLFLPVGVHGFSLTLVVKATFVGQQLLRQDGVTHRLALVHDHSLAWLGGHSTFKKVFEKMSFVQIVLLLSSFFFLQVARTKKKN